MITLIVAVPWSRNSRSVLDSNIVEYYGDAADLAKYNSDRTFSSECRRKPPEVNNGIYEIKAYWEGRTWKIFKISKFNHYNLSAAGVAEIWRAPSDEPTLFDSRPEPEVPSSSSSDQS